MCSWQKFLPTPWTSSSLAVQKLFSFLRCHLWTIGLNSGVNGILFKSPFSTSIFCRVLLMFSSTDFSTSGFTYRLWSIWSLLLYMILDTGLTLFVYTWTSSTIWSRCSLSPVFSHYENQCAELSDKVDMIFHVSHIYHSLTYVQITCHPTSEITAVAICSLLFYSKY